MSTELLRLWPDVAAAARADGQRDAVDAVQLYLDNGYELPLSFAMSQGHEAVTVTLGVTTSRQGVPRLRLTVGNRSYEPAAYRKVAADGRASRTRSVYLADEEYEALCSLGPWSTVARRALVEYLERHHADWRPE